MLVPIWFIVVAFLTEIMAAVVGFGSSTLLTPLASFAFEIKTALAVVAVFHVTGAAVRFLKYRKSVDRSFAKKFGLPAAAAALIGALLVRALPSPSLSFLLGLFLIGLVIFEWAYPKYHARRTSTNESIGGALTGFFGGLLGAGGALRAVSLQAFGMKKEEYIATSALIAVAVDLVRIPVYVWSGYLADFPFVWLGVLMLVAVFGTYLGLKVVENVPQRVFRLIVLVGVLLVAIKLVLDAKIF